MLTYLFVTLPGFDFDCGSQWVEPINSCWRIKHLNALFILNPTQGYHIKFVVSVVQYMTWGECKHGLSAPLFNST